MKNHQTGNPPSLILRKISQDQVQEKLWDASAVMRERERARSVHTRAADAAVNGSPATLHCADR